MSFAGTCAEVGRVQRVDAKTDWTVLLIPILADRELSLVGSSF